MKEVSWRILEVDVQYLKNYMTFTMIQRFYLEEWKLKKLLSNLHDKKMFYPHKKLKTSIKSWIRFEKSA